ncbi:MAG: T9SS type A sorting domain-containing protein [Flavobacteriales bacterium]|nr:T9SS type A sorting domain-containing protein [Flavobacteriales bacterium]
MRTNLVYATRTVSNASGILKKKPILRAIRLLKVIPRLATAASLFLAVLFVHGQTFNVVHYNELSGFAHGSSVREVPTGFIVFGIQTSQNLSSQDFTTTNFDINGNYQNDNFYSWQTADILGIADRVASMEGSNEYIAGICKRINGTGNDSLVAMKINNNGDSIWTKNILTKPNIDFSKTLVKDSSYYFIGGQNEDFDTPSVTFVIRTDTLANLNLYQTISYMAAYSIDVDSADNMYIAGVGSNKGYLHKINSDGGGSWIAEQNKPRGLWYGVKRMFGDNLLCLGSWNESSPLPGTPDINTMHLAMYSLNGSLNWDFEGLRSKPFGSNFGSFTDGFQDTDSTFIACGAIQQLYYNRAVIYRMTQNGDSLWRREYAHFGNLSNLYPEIPWDIEPTSDGGMVLTGETWNQDTVPPYSNLNMWLLKLDSLGCLVPGCQFVGIETIAYGLDNTLKAWPNPSAGQFTLGLDLPADLHLEGNLRLQVFDALGRSVMDRDLGLQLKQSIAVDLTDQPAGLYSAHLSDNLRI